MVLHRDFLMRAIQRLADVFFRLIAKQEIQPPEEAQDEIERAIGEVLGVGGQFAFAQGPTAIETLDSAIAAEVARLLLLHAKLSEQTGRDPGRAAELAMVALRRGLEPPYTERTGLAEEQLTQHIGGLQQLFGASAVANLFMTAFRWRRSRKEWDEAENWLFEAVERDREHVAEGVAHYEEILRFTDRELNEGGLPRAEVEESLNELRNLAED